MKQVAFQDHTQAVHKSVQSRLAHFLVPSHLIDLLGFSYSPRHTSSASSPSPAPPSAATAHP